MVGIILYVTTSQKYVMQLVGQVARFQETPKESHITSFKIILSYLKGTTEYGLWYPKGKKPLFKPLQMQIRLEVLIIVRVLVEKNSV